MTSRDLRHIWTSNEPGAVVLRVYTYVSVAFVVAVTLINLRLFI